MSYENCCGTDFYLDSFDLITKLRPNLGIKGVVIAKQTQGATFGEKVAK